MKTSIYLREGKEELQRIFDTSSSIREVIKKHGRSSNGTGGYRTLKKYMDLFGISTARMEQNQQETAKFRNLGKSEIKAENVLVEHSLCARHHVKRLILRLKLLPYVCRDCSNEGVWNSKSLSLELEHINGVNDDNRLENLCFLCPNCHSQTSTFSGKNKTKK